MTRLLLLPQPMPAITRAIPVQRTRPPLPPGRRKSAGRALPLVALAFCGTALAQAPTCVPGADLLLINGQIHTMNAADDVVSAVHILGDRIAAVGGNPQPSACTETIDLRGRTVVPGLIDNHNHIVLLGLRPGHDTRLESAGTIDAVLETLTAKAAELPAGQWITSIGGFDIMQFVPPPGEPRFPTLEELDRAAPDHPVYLQMSFAGPAVTNSLGRDVFAAQGIEVGEDGSLAGGGMPNPSTRALAALRALQTFEDQKRGTLDALGYAASLGLTTHFDQGGFPATGTESDGAAHFDPYRAYDALLELHREGRLTQRIRLNFLHMEEDPETPELRARLANAFPEFGDDMLRVVGIGEFTAGASPIIMQATAPWENGTRLVAEAGWRNENHSLTQGDYVTIIDGWERINAALEAPGITELRWVLAHAPFISQEYAEKLGVLGAGVSVLGGWRYISGTTQQNGPPFRMLVDSGIPVGMSSDGMQISPMNPWIGLYYVVTGKNARGEAINADQTLDRREALRLYTAANGWFLKEEEQLGSIERGKLADLAVLSANYFDEDATPDEDIRAIHSLLTIVGGNIVHGSADAL